MHNPGFRRRYGPHGFTGRRARSAELLPCNSDFSDFLAEAVLPLAAQRGLTAPREWTVTTGSSYGGLASTGVALRHPERIGHVLSLSGSCWWSPSDAGHALAEPVRVARRVAEAPLLPLRFYLDVGLFETGLVQQGILETNRHLREVLRAKGHSVTYAKHAGR